MPGNSIIGSGSAGLKRRPLQPGCPALWLRHLITTMWALVALAGCPACSPAVLAGELGNRQVLLSRAVTREAGLEGRLLWVDAYANFDLLSTRAGIAGLVGKASQARLNTIILGAKTFGGHALYSSSIVPRLTEWKNLRMAPGNDALAILIEEAHARGIKVHAAVDVFADGYRPTRAGLAYDHPEWQTVLYVARREVVTAEGQRLPLYGVNVDVKSEALVAYTPDYGWRKPPNPDPNEAQVVAVMAGPPEEMRILTVTDCALLRDGQPVEAPADALLLFGRGSVGDWMLRALRPGEQVRFAAADRFAPIGDEESEGSALFLNPLLPEVRRRALQIIEEIVRKYEVDGIIFDRMRFSGLDADFSDYARAEFERAIGEKVERWPDDILKVDPVPGRSPARGPLFGAWVEWRASRITAFLKEAAARVRAVKPKTRVGVYVGSWYDRYYQEGVNWASPEYTGTLDWMTATYGQTGYAGEVDYIATGCYYPRATAESALVDGSSAERTVELAARLSSRVVNDATFVYAGLYLIYFRDGETLREAIEAARRNTQGVMLFDAVYLNQYNTWSALEGAFPTPAQAPHDVPGLSAAVRRVRESIVSGSSDR